LEALVKDLTVFDGLRIAGLLAGAWFLIYVVGGAAFDVTKAWWRQRKVQR
jgi:hypothetical protein